MISVLVPVYNVEKYLSECLDSIASQTYTDLEIICINDGSPDGSGAILNEYKEKDSRFKIISQDNAGYGRAMNAGLDVAKGEYIGIVESDDFIDSGMYENILKWIEDGKADFVKTDYFRYKNLKDVYNPVYEGAIYDTVFAGIDVKPSFLLYGGNIWSGLYRKRFLLDNNIRFLETPGASYQDISFNFKVFACAKRILIKDSAFYHYRVDNENASVRSKAKVYCVCDELSDIQTYLGSRDDLKYVRDHWFSLYRFFCYRWNYKRIADEYKEDFLVKWLEEIVQDMNGGLIACEDFPDEMQTQLKEMLTDRDVYLEKEKGRIRERNKIRKSFFEIISGNARIYIYGAGKIANTVLDILKNKNISPDRILVKDLTDNPQLVRDIKVVSFMDEGLGKNDSAVLVSLGKKNLDEACRDLKMAGYTNIIPMTGELIETLS